MDNNVIGSSFNNIKSKNKDGRSGEGQEADDLGLFSKMLEEHTSKIDKDNKDSASQEIYSDKKEKEKAEEEIRQKARMGKNNATKSSKAYLYDLSLRDPATLSMSQKKAAGMEASQNASNDAKAVSSHGALKDGSAGESPKSDKKTGDVRISGLHDAVKDKGKAKDDAKGLSAGYGGASTDTQTSKDLTAAGKDTSAAKESQEAERNVKREEVIKQILQHVELRNIGNKTELTLKLNPEFLGAMKLRLLMDGDNVTAEFNTVSPAVREAMEESREELNDALKGQGIKVARMNFKLVDKIE